MSIEVRELAFSDAAEPLYSGQIAWRVMVPRDRDADAGIVIYTGPKGRVGCNPVSADEMWLRRRDRSGIRTPATREPSRPACPMPLSPRWPPRSDGTGL